MQLAVNIARGLPRLVQAPQLLLPLRSLPRHLGLLPLCSMTTWRLGRTTCLPQKILFNAGGPARNRLGFAEAFHVIKITLRS